MKKNKPVISNPDELNKHLQHNSPTTWVVLITVTALLIGLFVWSSIYKLVIKVTGTATIFNGEVTLAVREKDLKKLAIGQTVSISNQEGKILSFNDGQPIVSPFDLVNGEYTYSIVIGEKRPIEFLFRKSDERY